jgi:hypothetical protein
VTVCVPHDHGQIRARGHGKAKEGAGCIDEGPIYDSTACP